LAGVEFGLSTQPLDNLPQTMAKMGGGKKREWRAGGRGVRAKLEPEHEDHTRRMRKRDLNESQLSHDSEFQRNPQGHSTFFPSPSFGCPECHAFQRYFWHLSGD